MFRTYKRMIERECSDDYKGCANELQVRSCWMHHEVPTRPKQARSNVLFLDLWTVGSQRQFVTYIEKGSFRPSIASEKCCLRYSSADHRACQIKPVTHPPPTFHTPTIMNCQQKPSLPSSQTKSFMSVVLRPAASQLKDGLRLYASQ